MAYNEIKYKAGDCFRGGGKVCKVIDAFTYMRSDRYKIEILSVDKEGRNIDKYTAQVMPIYFRGMEHLKAKEYQKIVNAVDGVKEMIMSNN